jgi:hypothetical protein
MELAALRRFDLVDAAQVVYWASEQAASTSTPPQLVALASLPAEAESATVDRLLGEYLRGMGDPVTTDTQAGLLVAKRLARDVVDGALEPSVGARRIWWDVVRRVPELGGQLGSFVGLASEWEDSPNDRGDYELDIVDACRRLLAG